MTKPTRFAKGDQVQHPRRPQWGTGRVGNVVAITHENTPAQRLTINFANKGRVVINTAVAPLQPRSSSAGERHITPPSAAGSAATCETFSRAASPGKCGDGGLKELDMTRQSSPTSTASRGWLAALEGSGGSASELWDLPDALTNPFAPPASRLRATLETYQYSTEARALFAWATGQTDLDDPLSKYTRHELEQAFPRFARDRDNHLKQLIRQLKRDNDYETLKACSRGLSPAAQSAFDKAMRH